MQMILNLLKPKTETLVQSSLKLGEAIYKQTLKMEQNNQNNQEKNLPLKKDEKVVDAEFEEVDEKQKD